MTKLDRMYGQRSVLTHEVLRIIQSCLHGEITRPDADEQIEVLNKQVADLTHRILVCDPALRRADIGPRVRRNVRNYKPRPYVPEICAEV
jgi:hypothetical protein